MKTLLIYWIIAAFDFVVVVVADAQFDVVAAAAAVAYDDVAIDAVDIVVGNRKCWGVECC